MLEIVSNLQGINTYAFTSAPRGVMQEERRNKGLEIPDSNLEDGIKGVNEMKSSVNKYI